MAIAPTSSLHFWFRWVLFALFMGLIGWNSIVVSEKRIQQMAEVPLRPWEERHLVLTQQTQQDLNPEFTESVSEPLKKLAPHRTDGLAQPLWPWVAAWILDSGDLPGSLIYMAWLRVGIVLGCLLLLGIVCARNFSLPAALLTVALAAFYGLLPTITEFSGGTLFHLFLLLTWLACVYGLQRNSLWVYGLIGIFGALAYLSEDRIVPLLIVFILISTLRAFWGWMMAHWTSGEGTTLWVRRNHVFGLLLMACGFFSISGPRLIEAEDLYGSGFFHYVDQVRWLGTAAEGKTWIEEHPGKVSLKKVKPIDRPTPSSYLQSHPQTEITTRIIRGLQTLWSGLSRQGGLVLMGLMSVLIVLTLLSWCSTPRACHAGERLHPETATTVLFLVTAALTYALIAGWDSAVMSVKHLHALTAPLGLSLIWGCESVLRRAYRRKAHPWLAVSYQVALWLLLALTFL